MHPQKRFTQIMTAVLTLVSLLALPWLPLAGAAGSSAESKFLVGPPAPQVSVSSAPERAERPTAVHTVCPAGPPTCDYAIIQDAVDAAGPGDVIKIATGVYTDIHARPAPPGYPWPPPSGGITQVVYLSNTLTIQGGYTTTNWIIPDPIANPTTLDAQGQGRVLLIAGEISPTIEGLRITGGDAAGLDGIPWGAGPDCGGGIYVMSATATISSNQIFSNTAELGGGLFLWSSDATLSGNTVSANTANDEGGGLYLYVSAATLGGNTVISNTAREGGGLLLAGSAATVNSNTVTANTADWNGGGLALWWSDATLSGNTISTNTANDLGGGLYLWYSSDATLSGNTVSANTADDGGGLALDNSASTLRGNTIISNTASGGGGLYVAWESDPTLIGNTISANTANAGGGLYLYDSNATLINNVVADNQAANVGSGLYIYGSSPRLLHTTIARNGGGDGSGLHIAWDSTTALTNTILVSHTVGVYVSTGSTAILEATLWGSGVWANETDWAGDGTIITGTVNLWGQPAFVDPDAGDYHIGPSSAAIDTGVDAGVITDIDGEPRPAAFGYDIGADERPGTSLHLHKAAWPLLLNSGEVVTYTLLITSAGVSTATNVWLTDTLPPLQQAVTITTTWGSCAAGAGWGGQATCDLGTMTPGDSARITLTAQVTTTLPAQLPWPMRNTAWVTATEASNSAYADTMLTNCHVRLNDSPTEYDTVQAAVDASTQPTDVVKVSGYCMGVASREGITQSVYLSKTLTIQGGWNISFTQRNVISYPTTLDAAAGANGQGRVLFIAGTISPTVEGLRLTGGDAAGLGGSPDEDAGGGIYIITATATISNNRVFSNSAYYGGGLYLKESAATLSGNTVSANTAYAGGGLYLKESAATLSGNTVSANTAYRGGGLCLYGSSATVISGNTITANTAGNGGGGGLYLYQSDATLISNTVSANAADESGGGLYLRSSDATLSGNIIISNTAANGGGLRLYQSAATLSGNTISANTAGDWGGGLLVSTSDATLINNTIFANTARCGGGLFLEESAATLISNTVSANTANYGGGLFLHGSPATLSGNTITANTAYDVGGGLYIYYESDATLSGNTVSANTANGGGGVYLEKSDPTLTNNVVADNQADTAGSGLYIVESSPRLLHTTIARNHGGDGSGLHIAWYSTTALTNTILVSHTVGIYVTSESIATLEATLWGSGAWANETDWGGDGTIITGTVNLWGKPAFVAPDTGDYHIGPTSAALDSGVDAGVTIDIDGEPRPFGPGYDMGADELWPALDVTKQATPDPVQPGAQLTYTLRVTNPGLVTLTATITDVLPAQVTPTGVLTWTAQITPGDIWTETVVVTVELGYVGPLTNVVKVTTEEGATGTYTSVVAVEEAIAGLVATNDSPTLLGNPTTLTATITAGNPVFYAWDFGDSTVGSGAVVTHTYAAVGTYTALVTASNGLSLVTATTVVTITDVPISGLVATNDSPTVLGTPTTLTTTVTAGNNVTFTWAFGDRTVGSGAMVTHTYPTVGTYTALVTASNSVSVVTATTNVTITDMPIAGLVATNDGPTPLGSPTTLSTTVTAGSNVSYSWNLGDGTLGTGSVLTHTYSAVGIYTAVVTASNSVSVVTATMNVTITDMPIAGLTAINDSPTPLGSPTTLTATVMAGSSVVFTWAFGDETTGYGAVVTHTYPAALTYTAVVTASNSVSTIAATMVVIITRPTYYIYLPLVLRGW